MKQTRIKLSDKEINAEMLSIERRHNHEKDVLELARADLEQGIPREDIEKYLSRKYSLRQMQIYSDCLRNNFDEEVIGIICREDFNCHQMEEAYRVYNQFKDIEKLKKVVEGNDSIPDRMKATVNKCIEKTEQINSQKNVSKDNSNEESRRNVQSDEEVRQKLVDEISEKDKELVEKQDALNNSIRKVTLLNKELDSKNEQIKELNDTIYELQRMVRNKSDLLEDANDRINRLKDELNSSKMNTSKEQAEDKGDTETIKESAAMYESDKQAFGVPVYYSIPVMGGGERNIGMMEAEYTKKKSSGLKSLFSRICMKKKSHIDIVKLVSAGKLTQEQLAMIKNAMEKKLTEEQLVTLINSNLEPVRMKEVIEIAVMENEWE